MFGREYRILENRETHLLKVRENSMFKATSHSFTCIIVASKKKKTVILRYARAYVTLVNQNHHFFVTNL